MHSCHNKAGCSMMAISRPWQLLILSSDQTSDPKTCGWKVSPLATKNNNSLAHTVKPLIITQKTAIDLPFVTAN